jgi:hypothetical protein
MFFVIVIHYNLARMVFEMAGAALAMAGAD